MDSNVSKNTNSHNFFKLRVERKKLDISVQDLLSKELLSSLTLYQQQHNVKIEPARWAAIIKHRTIVSNHKNNANISSKKDVYSIFDARKLMPIRYRCPLGLCLATTLQHSPAIVVRRIGDLLILKQNNQDFDRQLELPTKIMPSGWIDFHLDDKFIAIWLDRLINFSQTILEQQSTSAKILSLDRTQAKLFYVQYLHARCYSLLALGAREKLLVLDSNSLGIKHSESIAWLDERQNLWLKEAAEYNLIRQLLIVTDAWTREDDCQWAKLALNLSWATNVFLAECRFLGRIKAEYPQLAIARLGLIVLVQFWLERILQTKLNLTAPREM